MTKSSIARGLIAGWVVLLASTLAAPAADIDPELIARAKKEGQLTYYTDLIVDQIVRPLTAAFEAKYAIKVAFTRADSQDNILKLTSEHRAGRVMAETVAATGQRSRAGRRARDLAAVELWLVAAGGQRARDEART